MKFYNRIKELEELARIRNLSFSDYSRMTVITGAVGSFLLADWRLGRL